MRRGKTQPEDVASQLSIPRNGDKNGCRREKKLSLGIRSVARMEVIMTSPVQKCLMMENGGGDDSAKMTKSKKRREKKKLKLNAENPDSKRILPHFYIISQSSLASVDQKHAASVPISGDANTGSKREDHMETSSSKMISDKIATPDAKIVTKGEEGTTATDNTVSKKRKRPRKKKNQASNDMVTVEKDSSKTATDDAKMVSKGENHMEISSNKMISDKTATPDAKTVSKGEDETKVANGEMGSGTTPTDNTMPKKKKDKKKKKKKNHEASNDMVTNGEMVSDTTATDNTVSKKRKRPRKKKNQASNDMVNVEKDSTKTATDEAETVSKGENHTVVTNASMGAKRVKMESVIQRGKKKVSGTTKPGKKLLIFDINGLLADIVSPRPQDVQADYYIPKRAIFKRPYLDGFLRFCFERFNVGIWSSRTKQVLYPVVDFLLGDLKKNLLFIWDNSFCTNTGMKTLEDKYKPMVFKDLRKIWLKNGLGNSWMEGTFNESNTLLLDDSPYKALLNPKNTAIFPLSYSYKDKNDDFLGPNGDLRRYLEGLAESDDVKTYVEQHPFGQSAIDQTHPSWAFYAKALKSQK
ncbi:unnamed protein product [Lactuca saligna]|uniref:Mitochondrial import inner membrane translocase subunit TIM50 n=1 Tax=Lactuca saligna TaxID=75948 RepID=A0AA35VHH4_LACSI|nr:unnamed protein product [Lactuca saligna]